MKKSLIYSIIVIIMSSCGGVKKTEVKLKTLTNKNFTVNYPSNWLKFGAMDYVYFTPKILKKENPEDELNHISINKNIIYANTFESFEKTLNIHGSTLRRREKNKKFEVIKINEKSNFIYKIESVFQYDFDNRNYKRVEYFFINDSKLDYLEFQMREDLFKKYINEAMVIINSFQLKDSH